MKICLARDAMAEAVSWAARSLPSRPPMPILAGLLIKASGDNVTMTGFNLETSAQVSVEAQVFEEGEVLVSGKLLADIARSLPNQPVEFTSDETQAELVCGPARFSLQTLPVADYPELPNMPTASGTIASDEFAKAISQVAIAAGRDELLPVFTGVRIEIDGEKLSLLATDRYRMALKELTWNPTKSDGESAALVPAKVLAEAAKSMTGETDLTVSLADESTQGEGLIGFEAGQLPTKRELTTRLLDGEFPKVRHLMNIQAEITVRVNREDLINSTKRVSLVAERNKPLLMKISEGQIGLEAATGDQAKATEAIEAVVEYFGEEATLLAAGFNPHFLMDALNAVDEPYVHFAFTGPGKPCLVMGVDSLDGEPNADYKHVIMLMRLQD